MDENQPDHLSDLARAVVARDALTAAVAADARVRPLFDAWKVEVLQLVERPAPNERFYDEEARQFVERPGSAPAPSDLLYKVLTRLHESAFAFIVERLEAPRYAALLKYTLPDVFARELATEQGWEWPEAPVGVAVVVLAPTIEKTFIAPRIGRETTDGVRMRLAQFNREIETELSRVERAAVGGRMPGAADVASLARAGRWLYELEIRELRRTQYDLERELHETRKTEPGHGSSSDCPCHSNVRDGLATARYYLKLVTEGEE
jgi:hypothetical protein